MATNPYVNKVQYGNDTLIDLTNDTATEETVLEGYTFHGADGQIRTGTAVAGGGDDKMDIDGTNADASVTFPNSAFTVGSRSSSFDLGFVENNGRFPVDPPYMPVRSKAVVYNDEIHILGSNDSSYYRLHYSFSKSSNTWTSISRLPVDQRGTSEVVVYNNKIHLLGGYNSNAHYSWNGSSWTSESTLPYRFASGSAVVYNNKIHILGGSSSDVRKYHYSWDGTSWNEESTLPYDFYNGSAVVYNNKIHILGGSGDTYAHYSWDGTSWNEESTLPYNAFVYGAAVIYNNKLHILGGGYTATSSTTLDKHYYWDGFQWVEMNNLVIPAALYHFTECPAVVYDNAIYAIGTKRDSNPSTTYTNVCYTYISYNDIIEVTESEKPGTMVQGSNSNAVGNYSYARGYNCLADGDYSKAEGINAYTFLDFQHVSKGSSNKFDKYEFASGRSLYNNVVSSILTAETAIDGRYGCSGTIANSGAAPFIKIDPQGIYLLFIAGNEGTSSSIKNSVHLISYNKITYFNQDGSTSRVHTVTYYNNSLYNIIQFSVSPATKAQFTLIRLI